MWTNHHRVHATTVNPVACHQDSLGFPKGFLDEYQVTWFLSNTTTQLLEVDYTPSRDHCMATQIRPCVEREGEQMPT